MFFSAALLAGGRSSRMGRDKASLEIDGVPLWRRQLQILRDLAPSELFVVASSRPEWAGIDVEVVPDAATDAGPLAGLVSAIRRCKTSRLLALAVDLPNMSPEFLKRLLFLSDNRRGVIPKNNERFEPLAAVYPVTSLALMESFLNAGRYSLQKVARRAVDEGLLVARAVLPKEEPLFFNLNTPEDLIALRERELPRTTDTKVHNETAAL